MIRMLELPTARRNTTQIPRRTGFIAAAVVVAAGVVFLASAFLVDSTPPAQTADGAQPSILACKLAVMRHVPVPLPATGASSNIAVSPAADGYRVTGTVTATGSTGTTVTLPWACGTEMNEGDWRVWSVTVGSTP